MRYPNNPKMQAGWLYCVNEYIKEAERDLAFYTEFAPRVLDSAETSKIVYTGIKEAMDRVLYLKKSLEIGDYAKNA